MLSKEKLDRLNELAKKAKTEKLNEMELEEQKTLREEYLTNFRNTFRKRLENIVFVDEFGNEIEINKDILQ